MCTYEIPPAVELSANITVDSVDCVQQSEVSVDSQEKQQQVKIAFWEICSSLAADLLSHTGRRHRNPLYRHTLYQQLTKGIK